MVNCILPTYLKVVNCYKLLTTYILSCKLLLQVMVITDWNKCQRGRTGRMSSRNRNKMRSSYVHAKRVHSYKLWQPRHSDSGVVRLTGTTLNSKVIYQCNHGYHPVGNGRRVCQSNGEWSGRTPVCRCRLFVFLYVYNHGINAVCGLSYTSSFILMAI